MKLNELREILDKYAEKFDDMEIYIFQGANPENGDIYGETINAVGVISGKENNTPSGLAIISNRLIENSVIRFIDA